MSTTTYTNVSVRLPREVEAALKAEQKKTAARSVTAVLQKHLENRLNKGFSVDATRQDRKVPRKVFCVLLNIGYFKLIIHKNIPCVRNAFTAYKF